MRAATATIMARRAMRTRTIMPMRTIIRTMGTITTAMIITITIMSAATIPITIMSMATITATAIDEGGRDPGLPMPSLRGAKRRSNPVAVACLECFAALAMAAVVR